ncbi:MAG TPA: HD-GYP domain-containing protein [Bacillota bacterium]|nr:HD-GYP domain-containing protein [Bacillota bacterium]
MNEPKAIARQGKWGSIIDTALYELAEHNINSGSHSNRVSQLCKSVGIAMGLPDIDVYRLEICGLFHDIGKLAVHDQILNKPGSLTAQEWDEIMQHPENGYRILTTSLGMPDIANYVLYHHERYDGSGYPKGLKGEEIPLLSRVITVVDAYDAMTNQRSYRETLTQSMAVEELICNKGKQFDPSIVDIFLKKILHINLIT